VHLWATVATRSDRFLFLPRTRLCKNLQKHLDVGHHLIKLERESDYDSIIAKWAETYKTVTGDYVQGQIGAATISCHML